MSHIGKKIMGEWVGQSSEVYNGKCMIRPIDECCFDNSISEFTDIDDYFMHCQPDSNMHVYREIVGQR